MNATKLRHIYYFYGLLPAFIALLIFSFVGATLFSISTFLMCYLWPYFIFTPGAFDRYETYRYRWSMAGLIVRFQTFLENALPGEGIQRRLAIALATPLIFCLTLWLISFAGEPVFALAGVATFALVYRYLLHPKINEGSINEIENSQDSLNVESLNEQNQPAQNHQTDNDSNS